MMKTLLLFGAMIPGLLFSKEHPPSLQALIVYDSSPKNLKAAYFQDAKRIQSMIKSVASATKLRLKMKVVSSGSLSEKTINQWTRSKKNSSKNVFFFYYAGQGLPHSSLSPQKSSIGVRYRCKGGFSCITDGDIVKRVKGRKPRLSVVLFDCYNNLTRIPKYGITVGDAVSNVSVKGSVKNISRLFLQSKGTITANSASSSEKATGLQETKPHGGLFTTKFLSALREAKQHVTWEQIMRQVSYYCRYDRYKPQQPIINVDETTDEI